MTHLTVLFVQNMSVDELTKWLETEDSKGAGWTGDNEGGETVGHDSGNRIVDILKRNPDKSEDKYTDEDLQHMRKVVAYCKRHLAQEGSMKESKSKEELEQTKSTKSLRNWGHDPLKGMDDKKDDKKDEETKETNGDKADGEKTEEKADAEESKEAENGENGNGEAKEEKAKPAKKAAAPKKEAAEKPAGRSQPSRSTRGVKKVPSGLSELLNHLANLYCTELGRV